MKVLRSTFVVLAFALCSSPSALAGNIAPNPSFTTDCSGVPCQWETTNAGTGTGGRPNAVVARDTSTFASSPASMRVTTAQYFGEGARTACLTSGIGNGTYSIGFSYRVGDNDVAQVAAVVSFYPDNACDPSSQTGPVDSLVASVDRPVGGWTNAWITLPPAADTITGNPLSARITLTVRPTDNCSDNIPAGCTAVGNFDDVIVDSPLTTAVRFQSAAASRSARGVTVRWRTAAEYGTLGFNVYREVAGKRQRLNRFLITGGRGSYSFLDRLAPKRKTVRYWIEEVAVDGSRSWHGPLRVSF